MSSFGDPFTPMPTRYEVGPTPEDPSIYVVIGSFVGRVAATPKSLAELVDTYEAGATYGPASACLIQREAGNTVLGFLSYPGGAGFYFDGDKGYNATASPFWIARNRAQLENLQLVTDGASIDLRIHFFTGNPNVSP